MPDKILNTRVQNKIDTTLNWTTQNPTLKNGELGIERAANNTIKIKIGDGTTTWNNLPYAPSLRAGDGIEIGQDNSINILYGKDVVISENLIYTFPEDTDLEKFEIDNYTGYAETNMGLGDPFNLFNNSLIGVKLVFNYSDGSSLIKTDKFIESPEYTSYTQVPVYTAGETAYVLKFFGFSPNITILENNYCVAIGDGRSFGDDITSLIIIYPKTWETNLVSLAVYGLILETYTLPTGTILAGQNISIDESNKINSTLGTFINYLPSNVWSDKLYNKNTINTSSELYYGNLYAYDRNGGLEQLDQIESSFQSYLKIPLIYGVKDNNQVVKQKPFSIRKTSVTTIEYINFYMDVDFHYYTSTGETLRLYLVPTDCDLYNLNFKYKTNNNYDAIFCHIYNAQESLNDLTSTKALTPVDPEKKCFALIVLWNSALNILSYVYLTPTNNFQTGVDYFLNIEISQETESPFYNRINPLSLKNDQTFSIPADLMLNSNFISLGKNSFIDDNNGLELNFLEAGNNNYNSGNYNIIGGELNTVIHNNSLTVGRYNIDSQNGIVCGEYNDRQRNTIFQIGGGSNTNSQINIFDVDSIGQAYIGAYDQINNINTYYPYWNAKNNKLNAINNISSQTTYEDLRTAIIDLINDLKNKGIMASS